MKSELCTVDIETGQVEVVLKTDRHIEAPNWTRDGAALIVNGQGRLFRVEFADPRLKLIDTDFAIDLNNDHGLSPDGKQIAITNNTDVDVREIFILPSEGGTPVRVPHPGRAYWHGWSPDGATLTYTALREGVFEICTIQVAGGEETQLTEGFDHCDGPDYSADGNWIWFNGEKDGQVDLYRVSPKGGTPERMTNDAAVNWFPHPSSDGNNIVYLAYPPGTEGHPGGLDVELRLMSQSGGESRLLVSLFGGQGTINVPSWSPDSRACAFVRYERN